MPLCLTFRNVAMMASGCVWTSCIVICYPVSLSLSLSLSPSLSFSPLLESYIYGVVIFHLQPC